MGYNISDELFSALVTYHLNEPTEADKVKLEQTIKSGLNAKIEAMCKRNAYKQNHFPNDRTSS